MARSGGLRGLAVGGVLAAVLALAGCGSPTTNTPAGTPSSTPANTPATTTPSPTTAATGGYGSGAGPSTTCAIPQGGGGDHDADNSGGPDDGDGCR